MRWNEASFMGARGYGATFPDAEGTLRGLIAAYMPLVGDFFWVALPKPTVGGPALVSSSSRTGRAPCLKLTLCPCMRP